MSLGISCCHHFSLANLDSWLSKVALKQLGLCRYSLAHGELSISPRILGLGKWKPQTLRKYTHALGSPRSTLLQADEHGHATLLHTGMVDAAPNRTTKGRREKIQPPCSRRSIARSQHDTSTYQIMHVKGGCDIDSYRTFAEHSVRTDQARLGIEKRANV